MSTPVSREQHSRDKLRSPTDLTDSEWDVIAPLLPIACPLGRSRSWCLREIVNGIFFVLRGGVPWRLLHPREQRPIGPLTDVIAGAAGRSRYAATEAALVALARSWAAELAPRGVTVNVVAPAAADAPMLRDPARSGAAPKLPPLGRFVRPDEVAGAAAFLPGADGEP